MKPDIAMKKILLTLVFLLSIWALVKAQEDINREVDVMKEYDPSIIDAVKINELPTMDDKTDIKPNFIYNTTIRQATTGLELNPVKAIKMVGEPEAAIPLSRVKLGFGNYISPLLAIDINSLRSDNYNVQASFLHRSSHGKIKMADDNLNYAGYVNNDLTLKGKYFFSDKEVNAALDYHTNKVYYYGYDPQFEPNPILGKDSMAWQRYAWYQVATAFQTNHTEPDLPAYKVGLSFGKLYDHFENTEGNFVVSGNYNQLFNDQFFLCTDLKISYFGKSDSLISTKNASFLRFDLQPKIALRGESWEAKAGFNLAGQTGDNSKLHFSPFIHAFYSLADFLVPYAGVTGSLNSNTLKDISAENPFIVPQLVVQPTNTPLDAFIGINGSVYANALFAYNLQLSYSLINNMYFFVNQYEIVPSNDLLSMDTTETNRFSTIYDDVTAVNFVGEISLTKANLLDLRLTFKYNNYNTDTLDAPLYKPKYQVNVTTTYTAIENLRLSAHIFLYGKQLSYSVHDGLNPIKKELKPVFDVSFGAEYAFSKNISTFLSVNNLTGVQYARWCNYPMQRFNFIGGIVFQF